MLEKTVLDYPFFTLMWVGGLSILGGIAHYIKRVNSGMTLKFSITELIGELFISGFVGLLTFFICDAQGIDIRMSAVAVGIAGHFGSRSIFIIERYLQKKTGIDIGDKKQGVL